MQPARASYQVDEDAHFALWKLVFRKSVKRGLFCGLGAVGVVVGLALGLKGGDVDMVADIAAPTLVGLLGAGAILMLQRMTLRRRSARIYRETASLRDPQILEILDDGFSIEQRSGRVKVQWMDVVKWDEDRDVFAIFMNQIMAYILPKGQIDQALIDCVRSEIIATGLTRPQEKRK